jgi:branched-chain amino acid transport system permease protein
VADWVILGKPFFLVIQWLITGLLVGGIYSLVALGLVLIFKSSGVFNFAHGWLMLIGGLIFWQFSINQNWPLWAGALFAVAGGVVLGLLIERFTLRPLIGQPVLVTIMMTLALAQILQGLLMLIWGGNPHPLPIFVTQNELGLDVPMKPLIIQSKALIGGNIILKVQLIWSFITAIASFCIFALFFRFTGAGLSMRATAEDHQLAQSVGLRVRRIFALAWAIAAVVAAASGVLHGSGAGLDTITVPNMALRAFPAVLLGGLESIPGALVGGLMIGVVEILTTGLVSSSAGQELAPFIVLMVVLMIRPDGLFGQKRIERV